MNNFYQIDRTTLLNLSKVETVELYLGYNHECPMLLFKTEKKTYKKNFKNNDECKMEFTKLNNVKLEYRNIETLQKEYETMLKEFNNQFLFRGI